MADLLNFPDPAADEADVAIECEPDAVEDLEIPIEQAEADPAVEPEVDPTPAPATAIVSSALVEILPADFPLPVLARFIPNAALRVAVDDAARYALSVSVEGPDGLKRADLALSALRTSLKAIDEHFDEPTRIANDLHKRLTGIRGEWQATGKAAAQTVGQRMYAEQRRLEDIAAEERRKAQAEADRQAREAAKREADEAARNQAPAPIVDELHRQAETATAPPVAAPHSAPPALKGSSTVTTWKARLVGTSGAEEPNPCSADFTVAQRGQALTLLKAILDGRAPLTAVEINWSYLNSRAKADKSTLAIPGIEAFEVGGVRAKSARVR